MIATRICLTIQHGHKRDKQQTVLPFPREPDIHDDFYSPLCVFTLRSVFTAFLQKLGCLNVNTDRIFDDIRELLLINLGVIMVLSVWVGFLCFFESLPLKKYIPISHITSRRREWVDGIKMRHELAIVEPGGGVSVHWGLLYCSLYFCICLNFL